MSDELKDEIRQNFTLRDKRRLDAELLAMTKLCGHQLCKIQKLQRRIDFLERKLSQQGGD